MTTKTGGPAFPTVAGQTVYSHGMTLRDWFATKMDRDEYGDQSFRHLSLVAKETLAGTRPEKPADNADRDQRIEWQIAEMTWELRVRAAVRYIYADAMLAARETSHE